MTLKQKVRDLCKERGITVKEFELESDVGISQTARWDKNVPSVDKVMKAAAYFGVSVDYLVGLTDIKEPAAPDECFLFI